MIHKFLFDYIFLVISIFVFFIPIIFISLIIFFSFNVPILHCSKRYGKNNFFFYMPKFRSMKINSPDLPTHLFDNPNKYITKFGHFLRKTSLDELPQLYSVLIRDMSFVGHRPALHNQLNLNELRHKFNVNSKLPGITGWAQINGRDSISIQKKVELEFYYINKQSFILDLKIIFLTIIKFLNSKNINH